jgi:hypothetical protein
VLLLLTWSGCMFMMRSFPVVEVPPACSTMKDMGAASYRRRSLPVHSGRLTMDAMYVRVSVMAAAAACLAYMGTS